MKGLDLDLGIGRAKSISLFNIDLSSLDLFNRLHQKYKVY